MKKLRDALQPYIQYTFSKPNPYGNRIKVIRTKKSYYLKLSINRDMYSAWFIHVRDSDNADICVHANTAEKLIAKLKLMGIL